MEADGALSKKLEAYVQVNAAYAEAIKSHQGSWVPTIVMGGGSGTQTGSSANDLVSLLMVKTAADLGLDLRSGKLGHLTATPVADGATNK